MKKRKMTLKLGFMPTRRNMYGDKAFHPRAALEIKDRLEEWLKGKELEYVNLDFLNEEGLLYHGRDADSVYTKFVEEKVDAVFCPHCNFGAEDAVAKAAKKIGKPLLLWGPKEEEPDSEGYRYRDSQCGLFATTKVLQRAGVPFTYITNCELEDPAFERLFDNFLSAATAVKYFFNMRIGQISLRPDAFWSVKCNEGELLERFGIDLVPLPFTELKKRYERTQDIKMEEVRETAEKICQGIDQIYFSKDKLLNAAAFILTMTDWAEEENLTAAATQCWGPMSETIGISPCFAISELNRLGFPVACETDVHGAISAVLAQAAARNTTPVFLADVTARHPSNKNAELFWHCGVFPKDLARKDKPLALNMHYNRKSPIVANWELKRGEVSLVRFDGVRGEYSLLLGKGKTTEGPVNHGTYVWLEFEDWAKWEHRFIYGPYIHHCIGIYKDVVPALYEASRYIPGLIPDPVEPDRENIEKYLMGGI